MFHTDSLRPLPQGATTRVYCTDKRTEGGVTIFFEHTQTHKSIKKLRRLAREDLGEGEVKMPWLFSKLLQQQQPHPAASIWVCLRHLQSQTVRRGPEKGT